LNYLKKISLNLLHNTRVPSISCLYRNVTRRQFHQHFTRSFFVRKCFYLVTFWQKKIFRTKNAHKKRWWNRHKVSGTLLAHLFTPRECSTYLSLGRLVDNWSINNIYFAYAIVHTLFYNEGYTPNRVKVNNVDNAQWEKSSTTHIWSS